MYEQSLAFFTTLLNEDFTDYCSRRLAEAGLLQGQLYFILYVGKHPGYALEGLVRGLRMNIGHTTRSPVKLEQRGLLEQESNPDGRCAHILRLTERGEAAFHPSHELFAQRNEMVLDGFTVEEKEQLMGLLKKILHMEGEMPCIRNNIQSR